MSVHRADMSNVESHPSWVRGLKQNDAVTSSRAAVAPLVGAWIETRSRVKAAVLRGRTPRGCVD